MPLLTQPFEAGLTGWIVVFGGVIAELAGGAAVANQTSTAIAALVLILPVVVVFGFAVVQWLLRLSEVAFVIPVRTAQTISFSQRDTVLARPSSSGMSSFWAHQS